MRERTDTHHSMKAQPPHTSPPHPAPRFPKLVVGVSFLDSHRHGTNSIDDASLQLLQRFVYAIATLHDAETRAQANV